MFHWSYICKLLRRYVLSPESFCVLVLLFIIFYALRLTFMHTLSPLWQKAKDKFRIKPPNANREFQHDSDKFGENPDLYWPTDPNRSSWEFKSENVAAYSIQGRRPHMEDRFKVYNNGNNVSMYGIFDGHGGEFVAEYVKEKLFPLILANLSKNLEHGDLLVKQILEVDDQVLKEVRKTSDISGTTALVALVTDTTLTVANVGDSRGVMCDKDGNTVPLSVDHKPNQIKEHQRIKDAGGFVGFNGVWRVAGILATSRALGDYPLKENNFIIAEPDILTFSLQDVQPKFIILATDGLWDCFSNEQATEYIKERLDEPHFGAKSIILQAYYKGSLDNITVIVIKFDKSQFKPNAS